ncbi:MAG: anhydro-N-acetylmuramic acid kinase [Acidobacteria bacterium]|nr:anhydro-N-acetylmuramic acid kinase [Acidobacteriota bacterium]
MRVAGIMSGTSLDGIDVAIVDIRGGRFATVATHTSPYPEAVRHALLEVSNAVAHTGQVARLNFLLGELYAEALKKTCRQAGVPLRSIGLIGCHGQTIFHDGRPVKFLDRRVASTFQIGEAAVLAERTGIPVVNDFRPRDIACGGCGAPLVPLVDYLLFHHRRLGRVALNVGGIANLTAIPPAAPAEEVIAFDTGPGNMVIDQLIARFTGNRWAYDRYGRMARRGSVDHVLLEKLLRDPFYWARPPKTAGREQYGKEFVDRLVATGLEEADLVATATALTPAAVAVGIERFVRPRMPVDELIVSGGGAHNPEIMGQLAALLPGAAVATSADFGIDIDAKEAIAFAVLAWRTWRRRPGNLPSATGARRAAVLGRVAF